jgi:endoglucanase
MKRFCKTCSAFFLGACFSLGTHAQQFSEDLRINQIGFYPKGEKVAVIVDTDLASRFYLLTNTPERDTVYSGVLSEANVWDYSEERVKTANFTNFRGKGEFILFVPRIGYSHPFHIEENSMKEVAEAALRTFYYHRAGIDLPAQYAGKWARKGGHMDDKAIVHNSAAFGNRKTGDIVKSSKGWFDAGDYNKYVVNSSITMYTLMCIQEDFPYYATKQNLNIPESKNKLPDVLDEILWNLRWMLTMQDPQDGGVYHKLTNATWDGTIMPELANNPRYMVKKTTNASLDFAAVLAQASRVFGRYRKQFPGLADSCIRASKLAYEWAKKNEQVPYIQKDISDPTIVTGAYDDYKFTDEFLWASLELFITTGKMEYYDAAHLDEALKQPFSYPNWQSVEELGIYSLAKNALKMKEDSKFEDVNFEGAKRKIVEMGKALKNHQVISAYNVPMGTKASDFAWGSNGVCANEGFILLQSFLLTGEWSYLEAANANLDYLLGRNALGYSFVTGFGEKSARNPHHRLSEADNIEDPVPGFLVGGPNSGQEDKGFCMGKYTSTLPAKSYIDNRCSWASNEIAINWNAVLSYLANGLEAIRSDDYEHYE